MDIDSPPIASIPLPPPTSPLTLPSFSSAFPLPFRVLSLIALAILLWATNVHALALLGIDVSAALDLGASEEEHETQEDEPGKSVVVFDVQEGEEGKMSFDGYGRAVPMHAFPSHRISPTLVSADIPDRPTAQSLYRSIYALFATYSALVALGWLLFRVLTTPSPDRVRAYGGDGDDARGQAEREMMERWRAVVGAVGVGIGVMGLGTGFGYGRWKVGERERQSLLRCVHIQAPSAARAPLTQSQVPTQDHHPADDPRALLRRRHPRRHSHLVRQSARRLVGERVSDLERRNHQGQGQGRRSA